MVMLCNLQIFGPTLEQLMAELAETGTAPFSQI